MKFKLLPPVRAPTGGFRRSLFLRARSIPFNLKGSSNCFSSYDSAKPFSAIPGPKPFPFLGNIGVFKELAEGKCGKDFPYTRLSREYGDIYKLYLGNTPVVVINDADYVQMVINSEGKLPVRMKSLELNVKWIHDKNKMPTGMVLAHKEEWKKLRSAMAKQVTPRRLTQFFQPVCEVSDVFCNYIEQSKDSEGWMEDIWRPAQNWSLKGITKVVFNEDIDTFYSVDPQTKEYVQTILEVQRVFGTITQALPLYKIYPTKPYKEYVSARNKARLLAKKLLSNRYETLHKQIETGLVDENGLLGLLDQWLIEGKLSEEEAFAQASDIMGAGLDTTSNTATFMLHELAKNPDVQAAVYKEIVDTVGTSAEPTEEQLQKLSLVRKCVKETLRLYPVMPLVAREVVQDIVVLGYQIPANTACLFNYIALSTNPKYFKEPSKFDPDRWSRDSSEINPFASLPFGLGQRMCYGRRIAELELHILLMKVLQRYTLSTDQGTLKQSFRTILNPEEPVKVRFISRKQ